MSYVLLPDKGLAPKKLPATVRVRQLDITPAYDTERIVYRYSPYEFQYYNYMLWAVKPQKMITDMLIRHLQHAKLFADVSLDYGEHRPDFEIFGTMHAIEELDSGDEWFAHLAFSLRMTRFRGEKIVWSHDVNVKKQVYNKSPVYVVKALSELMETEMEKVVSSLYKYTSSQGGRGETP
jgi:ABC-type uncharacterized transport system auxiliary subunit